MTPTTSMTPAEAEAYRRGFEDGREAARWKASSITTEEVVRRYLGGESIEHLARAIGISPRSVTKRLIDAGVPRRKRGLPKGYRLLKPGAAMEPPA